MNPRAPWRAVVGTIILAATLLGWTAAPAGAQAPESSPTIAVTPRAAAPGAEVQVRGDGWPARELVMVEVCGNNALLGSPDCAQSTSRTVSTDAQGRTMGMLTVPTPPTPCPCVVRAFIPTEVGAATVGFEVVGHPTAPLREAAAVPPPALTLRASLEEIDEPLALFGVAPVRALHLEIENISDAALVPPPILASFGRSPDGDGYIEVPRLESIAPGETVEVTLPFELPTAAFGSYTVTGQLLGVDGTAFAMRTSSVPWGLLVIPVVLLLHLGAARLRRRARRVIEPDHVDRTVSADVGEDDVEIDARDGAVQAIDLRDAVLHEIDLHYRRMEDRGWPRRFPRVTPNAASVLALAYRTDLRGVVAREIDVREEVVPDVAPQTDGEDERELVGAAAGPAPRRRRTFAGLSLALLASIGLFTVGSGPADEPALSGEAVCETLVQHDVVSALADADAQAQTAVVGVLAGLARRVPPALQPALSTLADVADAMADPEASDPWIATANRLEDRRRFDDAAAEVERYAVEECGMQPSGRFDLGGAATAAEAEAALVQPLVEAMNAAAARGDAQAAEPPAAEFDGQVYVDVMNTLNRGDG